MQIRAENRRAKLAVNIITGVFLSVPFIFSIVSMVHVYSFLNLGNNAWISGIISITYEIANLSILMAVVVMVNLRQTYIWICFFILLIIQVIGNVYYSFEFIYSKLDEMPQWLSYYIKFYNQFDSRSSIETKIMILSCILGIPIPSVSLLLTKSGADYLRSKTSEETIIDVSPDTQEEDINTDQVTDQSKLINKESKYGLKVLVRN